MLGGLVGLVIAVFGARMLVAGRAPRLVGRAFPNAWEAGCHHLLLGVSVIILAVSVLLPAGASRTSLAVMAILLIAIALVRFRPGRRG